MLALANAAQLPLRDRSVNCVVTSPPYWGLRDYDLPPMVWGGEAGCEHEWGRQIQQDGRHRWTQENSGTKQTAAGAYPVERGTFCRCGAWRGTLGTEPTPDLYIAHLVAVFREVRRVLQDDGTVWLNLGDSYCSTAPGTTMAGNSHTSTLIRHARLDAQDAERAKNIRPMTPLGLKAKDLVGIPWRVAFALQADGWWLREDIIWSKKNGMPESVRDRCTRSHEYLFHLAKSERYYHDADAIAEPATMKPQARLTPRDFVSGKDAQRAEHRRPDYRLRETQEQERAIRNRRSVWHIATSPYPGAHFATFPVDLVKPCVLAGCPIGGLVLDPFCGTATVGEACGSLGRRFIGLDLSAKYLVNMASDRIAQRGLML